MQPTELLKYLEEENLADKILFGKEREVTDEAIQSDPIAYALIADPGGLFRLRGYKQEQNRLLKQHMKRRRLAKFVREFFHVIAYGLFLLSVSIGISYGIFVMFSRCFN